MLLNCDIRKLIPVVSFFFFNFLKLIIGAIIFVFSIYVASLSFFPVFLLAIIIGIKNISLGLFGFYGVTLASEKKLKWYQYFLSVSLIATIIYMAALIVFHEYIPTIVYSVYEAIFLKIRYHSLDIIDELQLSLDCSGFFGPDDFHERFKIRKNFGFFFPSYTECSWESMENKIGCVRKLVENTKSSIFTIIIIFLTLDTILLMLARTIVLFIQKHELNNRVQGVPYSGSNIEIDANLYPEGLK